MLGRCGQGRHGFSIAADSQFAKEVKAKAWVLSHALVTVMLYVRLSLAKLRNHGYVISER
jgi:hypothetical protein